MSNFAFLRAEWPELFGRPRGLSATEWPTRGRPASMLAAPWSWLLAWLYEADRTLQQPYRDDCRRDLFEPTFRALVGNDIQTKCDLIRRQGNTAVHKRGRSRRTSRCRSSVSCSRCCTGWRASTRRDPANLPAPACSSTRALVPRPMSAQSAGCNGRRSWLSASRR